MSNDVIYKFAKWVISLFIVIYVGFYAIYGGFFRMVNEIDDTIFYRYASDNQFASEIYFSREAENEANIISELNQIEELADISPNENKLALFGRMSNNMDEISIIMNDNDEYRNYLSKNNTSVENAKEYVSKMANMNNKILQLDTYLVFLIICFLTVGAFKYRKTFYIVAGITYMLLMASTFSDGLSDYIVTNIINFLVKLQSSIFTYQDMKVVKEFLIEAFKESMMTFIIFDTVMQIFGDKKEERRIYQMRYVYNSINIQIDYFKEQEKSYNTYIGKMKFNASCIIKECNKNIRRYEKLKKIQKTHNGIYDKYIFQLSCWTRLRENIMPLAYNKKEYNIDEYMNFLKQARDGMVACKLI